MSIEYKVNTPLAADIFVELLSESTLGERRPIDDRECMDGMVKNSNLMVTAWYWEKTASHNSGTIGTQMQINIGCCSRGKFILRAHWVYKQSKVLGA